MCCVLEQDALSAIASMEMEYQQFYGAKLWLATTLFKGIHIIVWKPGISIGSISIHGLKGMTFLHVH